MSAVIVAGKVFSSEGWIHAASKSLRAVELGSRVLYGKKVCAMWKPLGLKTLWK